MRGRQWPGTTFQNFIRYSVAPGSPFVIVFINVIIPVSKILVNCTRVLEISGIFFYFFSKWLMAQ